MKDKAHTLVGDWRGADISSLNARVHAIEYWLEHTEDLLRMLKDDGRVATDLRSMAGVLRTRRDDFKQKAAELKAELVDESPN